MRSLDSVFGIAGTALNAQMVRMNTTASNLANATTVAGSEKDWRLVEGLGKGKA